jgi:DNA-binding NarL/FixJ family response regulator
LSSQSSTAVLTSDVNSEGESRLKTSLIRVLLVDDFEPFRRCAASMLQKHPDYLIVGEALDGLEAVQKAEELQPNLILLDIGLPSLNGIEAARQLRYTSPSSKIIFVTENQSLEVAQAALNTGAWGYVIKSDAASELLEAVEAVLQGKRFVSSRLAGYGLTAKE